MTDQKGIAAAAEAISKPLTKLIETVGAGCGVLYEPTRIKRKALAEAEASVITAQANVQSQEIGRRAAQRFAYQEIRNQENIESIIDKAEQLLPAKVSDNPVDPDWTADFFEHCKRTSNSELQAIWARLLAGEVTKPGTSSRRTLNIVKALEPTEAKLFELIVQTSWRSNNKCYWLPFFHAPEGSEPRFNRDYKCDRYNIDKDLLLKLRLLNLILPLPIGTHFVHYGLNIPKPIQATFQNRHYNIAPSVNSKTFIPSDVLTPWGEELSKITITASTPNYHEMELKSLREGGFTVEETA